MFLGTPHSGSGLAQWAVWFATAIKPLKKTSTAILEVLKRNSEVLARIQTDFHTMIRDMSQNGHPIKLMCFYEEIPVQGIGFVSQIMYCSYYQISLVCSQLAGGSKGLGHIVSVSTRRRTCEPHGHYKVQ